MAAICSMCKPEIFSVINETEFHYLNSKQDFTAKMLAMIDILQLTEEEIQERKSIQEEIATILRPYYPNCALIPFGSSVNGFGFRGCDIDLLFLPFPGYCNLDFKDYKNVAVPSPQLVRKGKYPKERLLTMNESSHLKFVQRIMYGAKYYFKKVIFIPAKCPILNIDFIQSHITCDFSASNRLVINNTELQMLYGSLDYRVRPLMMFLRYWAKALGFIQKTLLSSYAFTLLVIFYLQNTQPPILPSVKRLIELSEYSCKIDDWETSVCQNMNDIPTNRNYNTIDEILLGFFDFYWNFDFIHNIVSPYIGKAIPIKELLESNDERIKTFMVTPFSIQDPFILSRNISRNAVMKTSFKLALLIAKRLLLERNFPLQNLFDFSFYQAEIDKIFLPVLQNCAKSTVSNTVHFNYKLCCKLGVTNELYPWHEKVCQIVLDILQYGLLFECEVVDKVIWNKKAKKKPRKKRKLNSDSLVNLELIMSIQCAVYYDTWHSRKKLVTEIMMQDDFKDFSLSDILKTEYDISRNMIQGKNTDTSPLLWFFCNCYAYSKAQISDVILIFLPVTNAKMFSSLSNFLKSYVHKHVKNILNED